MGHILPVGLGNDQGPLLNRVSLAQYTIAVAFVALRYILLALMTRKMEADHYQLFHSWLHSEEVWHRRPIRRDCSHTRWCTNNNDYTSSGTWTRETCIGIACYTIQRYAHGMFSLRLGILLCTDINATV